MADCRIVIVGAGPTGLGAAHRLSEMGYENYVVLESLDRAGGLSRSFGRDGFTWDIGGHVVFSHYPAFDRMIEDVLPDPAYRIERRSYVRILGTWAPYPIQNNLRYLPAEAQFECLTGLLDLIRHPPATVPGNFLEWIHQVFGRGFARLFMEPYNFKVWATPPGLMDRQWISERVSVVDFERALRNIIFQQDDTGWGPNNAFGFPRHGGTGAIWSHLAERFADHIRYGASVESVDVDRRVVCLAGGEEVAWDHLISTMPLDRLAGAVTGPAGGRLAKAAEGFVHSGTLVVGVGLEKPMDAGTCWMYFPESNCPFYRVTNFAQYSNFNVPGGDTGRYSSFMCETSYSPHKVERPERIVEQTIEGLVNVGLMDAGDRDRVVSTFLFDADYGYPVPTLGRDASLGELVPWFESRRVYPRGRFGAWKYETGNMDHSYQMGREVVERILEGKRETVLGEKHGRS